MKKKLMFLCGVLLCATMAGAKDFERGIFNHVGVQVGAGTEGWGFGLAAPLTPYLELGVGLNFFPNIKIKDDVDAVDLSAGNGSFHVRDVKVTGEFGRTTCDVKVNCYPFPKSCSFFVAAGLSIGGKSLAKLSANSPEVKNLIAENPELLNRVAIEFDDYNLLFDKNGNVGGSLDVSSVRPYVGLGFGRLVPKRRVGARFELGCQFHGKAKVIQDGKELKSDVLSGESSAFTDIKDKVTVYPVLKFQLTGRIL